MLQTNFEKTEKQFASVHKSLLNPTFPMKIIALDKIFFIDLREENLYLITKQFHNFKQR
jgi:hypothetical protein